MTKQWVFKVISVCALLAIGGGMVSIANGERFSFTAAPSRVFETITALFPSSIAPFPQSQTRATVQEVNTTFLPANPRGLTKLRDLTDADIPPVSLETLAGELKTSVEELKKLEEWIQAKWDEYQKNPNPQLEALKQELEKRFYAISEKTLGFSPFNPPENQTSLTEEQFNQLRNAVIEDSETQEFKALEEKLISFGSIPDEIQSNPQLLNLHRAGTGGCVSPNTCYRQPRSQGGSGGSGSGINAFAPCCNCSIWYIPIGCLNLICPWPRAAIYDYCTFTCGCNL